MEQSHIRKVTLNDILSGYWFVQWSQLCDIFRCRGGVSRKLRPRKLRPKT